MPYFITDSADGCDGWATIKEDGTVLGCHATKQAAIDQMVAVSLAEDMAPGGERDAGDPSIIVSDFDNTLRLPSGDPITGMIEHLRRVNGQGVALWIVSARNERERDFVTGWLEDHQVPFHEIMLNPGGGDPTAYKRIIASQLMEDFNIVEWIDDNGVTRQALSEMGIRVSSPSNYRSGPTPAEIVRAVEDRAVDVPGYVRRAAARGLQLRADGFGGDGLTDQTIREARQMADGSISEDKVLRAAAWAARHAVDLEAPRNSDSSHPRWPGPGAVAHYLWGIDPLNPSAARDWFDRQAAMIMEQQQTEGRLMPTTKEFRAISMIDMELRDAEDGMSFSGYAAVYDSPSEPLPFVERIAPGAFDQTLKSRNNVFLLRNHDPNLVLATTRSKTMTLTSDTHGLRVEAKLPNTTDGRDMSVLLRDRIIDSMSFGFSVNKGGDSWSQDGMQRTLRSVRLHEVSIVTNPAYRATSASVRSIDRLADVTGLDPDQIGKALDALEAGQSLSNDQADLIGSIVGRLKPAHEPANDPAPVNSGAMIDILRKRLDLAAKL